MAENGGRWSVWLAVLGTLLGGAGGAATVVALIRDYNNPVAQKILSDTRQARANGKSIADAIAADSQAEERAWQVAVEANNSRSYQAYVDMFPGGAHVSDALQRRSLALQEELWLAALRGNTPESYDAYLAAFPAGKYASAAEAQKAKLRSNATVAFSIYAVADEVRPTVERARGAATLAIDAQRKARDGRTGYKSTLIKGGAVAGVNFEGKVIPGTKTIFYQFPLNYLGVFTFTDIPESGQMVGAHYALDKFEGQNISFPRTTIDSTPIAYCGTAYYRDGRRYDGDLISTGGVAEPPLLLPNGFGAMWSADGVLLGSGTWKKGVLISRVR